VCVCKAKGTDNICCCVAAFDSINNNKRNFTSSRKEPATMKNIWIKWAMEFHTFNDVEIFDNEVEEFSNSVKELMVFPSLSSGKVQYISLPSLKYYLSSNNDKKQGGLILKSLTNDQRLQNKIFIRECRNLWLKANEMLNYRIVGFVIRLLCKTIENHKIRTKQSNIMKLGQNVRKFELKVLFEISLKKLRHMIEDDDDINAQKEIEIMMVKLKEAKSSHEQFVKLKDRYCNKFDYLFLF
jgi:hypothetical protein